MRADAYLARRRKMWYVRYLTDDGRWAQESLHFAGPKAQALDKLAAWKTAHRVRPTNASVALTFAQLAEFYLKRAADDGRSPGWVMHQRQHLHGPMAKFFGATTVIRKISRPAVEAYLSMLTKSVKRTTANKHRACLRRMFQFAVEQGYLATSPAAEVRRLKHDGIVHNRFLTADEFKRLRETAELQRAAQAAVPTAHAFDALPEYLDLAVSLATRPTETLTLKFTDIDWWNRFIAVRKTKSGKDRVLPLNNTAMAALRTMQERRHPKSDLVFHRADGRAWKDMRETFNAAVRAAGLWHPDPQHRVTRHTLRHTALSWMAQHGEPLQKIARFAGHSSTHVTETYYAHLQPDHLTHAAGVIDAALGNFLATFLTTSPDSGDAPDQPRSAQTPDTLHVTSFVALRAGVAKLADARDSKSCGLYRPCGFDSLLRHHPASDVQGHCVISPLGCLMPTLTPTQGKIPGAASHADRERQGGEAQCKSRDPRKTNGRASERSRKSSSTRPRAAWNRSGGARPNRPLALRAAIPTSPASSRARNPRPGGTTNNASASAPA